MIAQSHSTSEDQWRSLALRFHCIEFMTRLGRLPKDFEPAHLSELIEREPVSRAEMGIIGFLLHTWDPGEHPFELSSAMGWDRKHLAAMAAWITGEATGEPLHYF